MLSFLLLFSALTAKLPTTQEALLTPHWFESQQAAINQGEQFNQRFHTTLTIAQQALNTKIASLDHMTLETMVQAIKAAEQEKDNLNSQVEEKQLTYTQVQTQLNTFQAHLDKQQAALNKTQEATTEVERQRTILNRDIELQQQAITSLQHYLNVLKENIELLNKQLQFAIIWHIQLQQFYYQQLLAERRATLTEIQTNLERRRQSLDLKQQELTNQMVHLESTNVTVDSLKELFEKLRLEKEAAEIETENLRLERQSVETNLIKRKENLAEQKDKRLNLQKNPVKSISPAFSLVRNMRIGELENTIAFQQSMVTLEEQQLHLLKTTRQELVNKRRQLAEEWFQKIQTLYQQRQQQILESHIQQQQQYYLTHITELERQLEKLTEDEGAQRYLLEAQIAQAKEQAQQYDLKIDTFKETLDKIKQILSQEARKREAARLDGPWD